MSENQVNSPVQAEEEPAQDINILKKDRLDKLADLRELGHDPFTITKFDVTGHAAQYKAEYEAKEAEIIAAVGDDEEKKAEELEKLNENIVRIAGRIMSWRDMGKANFIDVRDKSDRIQVYIRSNDIGADLFKEFKKKWDIGDIIGVEGYVFRTRKGEISIHAKSITLLTKSLLPLPEKWHGLKDTDTRYRQRYLDLVINPEVKDTFIKRSMIISSIRRYLDAQGFMEVETPMLVSNAGGAAARPFETHYNALDEDVKLRISLELYLKRLIVGGLERVYEIGRVFRNEGVDTRHNPEFTLMELYQAYTDYYGMMDLTENMFRHVAQEVCGTTCVPYGEYMIDLGKPFERLTMIDAVKKYSGVDFTEIKTLEEARKIADEKGVEYEDRHKRGDILNLFFEAFVEEHLIQPTFIMDHPIEISPLTKKKPDAPDYVERFELFITGREMCNAYSELNDPIDQRERFKAQEEALSQGDEEANRTDEDFLNALEIGMPPTGGIGYGIDRLVMLLTNSASIRDVLLSLQTADARKRKTKQRNNNSTGGLCRPLS
jgi:lysyl-tRNA synthetase class 2